MLCCSTIIEVITYFRSSIHLFDTIFFWSVTWPDSMDSDQRSIRADLISYSKTDIGSRSTRSRPGNTPLSVWGEIENDNNIKFVKNTTRTCNVLVSG